jgi:hypothetical protein
MVRCAPSLDVMSAVVIGTAALRPDNDNLPDLDESSWASYRDRLETAAREAAARSRTNAGDRWLRS